MKIVVSIAALCFVTACGGGGGSSSNPSVSSAGSMSGPGVSSAAPAAPTTNIPQVAVSDTPSSTFAGMLNGVRARNGAGSVSYDSRLGAAARRHADDMAANNFFSHTGSDGSSGGDRITDAGYNWRTWGENIARGQQSESSVLNAWVNSPGHQANNVNPRFEDFALAKANSNRGPYWVLVLAAEQ
ncbi:CAP domain-containing protein [Yoonia sp. GPGPB17]|uniref:CAP domain-containing protein n=1 Tax=Yoonia sp. GPGPB17 TaxID=3026147 RepID=UPI0030C36B67